MEGRGCGETMRSQGGGGGSRERGKDGGDAVAVLGGKKKTEIDPIAEKTIKPHFRNSCTPYINGLLLPFLLHFLIYLYFALSSPLDV